MTRKSQDKLKKKNSKLNKLGNPFGRRNSGYNYL